MWPQGVRPHAFSARGEQDTMTQPSGLGGLQGELLSTASGAPAPAGAPPLPLPVTGEVQVTQGQLPAPPPDPSAAGVAAATAAFSAAYSGKGWKFDIDGLNDVINGVQDVIDLHLSQVGMRMQIRAPGDEVASDRYAAAANASLRAFNEAHDANTKYLRAYADTLREVRDAYLRQDHEALDALRGAAGKD